MAIEFRCSHCNQLLRVPEDTAGKNARCPKCQSLMTVPAASQPGASQPLASPPPAPLGGGGAPFSPLPSQPGQPPVPLKPADPFSFLNQPRAGAGGAMPPPPANPFAGLGAPQPPKPAGNPFAEGGAPPPHLNPYASSSSPSSPYSTPYGPPNPNQLPMLLAIGSLITSAIGLLSCGCCFFIPFPPIALIMGITALCQKPDQAARIIAIIGIVISGLSLILFIIGMFLGLAGMAMDPQFQQALGN